MTRKASDADIENAISDYVSGDSVEVVAARHHTSYDRVRDELGLRGLMRSPKESNHLGGIRRGQERRAVIPVPASEIVSAYHGGTSEKRLSEIHGVTRRAIRRVLIEHGANIRGQAEANRVMVSKRSVEENRQNTAAAHAAARGRVVPIEERSRVALTRQERQLGISAAELQLTEWLSDRGLQVIPQQAVGPYNVDLGTYPVAVEIFGGGWHATGRHKARSTKRYRYILDQGWTVVIVWVDQKRYPLSVDTADYLATFIQQTGCDESARGKYWVIWGDGKVATANGTDLDQIPFVSPRGRSENLGA